ncbi:hypothetical protein AB0L63_22250 [Nocardia sp. NPDC051990]|uniref:hypothetical protein n=1 Tax=Nocardia sp. NPDC051990 TaxID=3155285 RepID=UPI00342B3127
MSWKVRLGVGILALLGALMLIGFVKSLVLSLVPLAILLLAGYGVYRLYIGSRGKATEAKPQAPQLPTTTPPAIPTRPTKDAATRLREIREEAARQQGQQS